MRIYEKEWENIDFRKKKLKGRRRIRMFSSLRFIWIWITECWTVPII